MLIKEGFGEGCVMFEASLQRSVKVSQTKAEKHGEKEGILCKSKGPAKRFNMMCVELSSLALLEPLCSWGRIKMLPWYT